MYAEQSVPWSRLRCSNMQPCPSDTSTSKGQLRPTEEHCQVYAQQSTLVRIFSPLHRNIIETNTDSSLPHILNTKPLWVLFR